MKMVYFGVPSFEIQDALWKKSSRPAAACLDKGKVPPAASAIVDDANDGGDWDLTSVVGLDDVDNTGAKRSFRGF